MILCPIVALSVAVIVAAAAEAGRPASAEAGGEAVVPSSRGALEAAFRDIARVDVHLETIALPTREVAAEVLEIDPSLLPGGHLPVTGPIDIDDINRILALHPPRTRVSRLLGDTRHARLYLGVADEHRCCASEWIFSKELDGWRRVLAYERSH